MSDSPEIERKIRTFSSIEDIVNAMKAYAGVTIKRTEEMVKAVRAYEEQVVRALALATALEPGYFAPAPAGGRRIVAAFGSSQGLCGPLNEHVADTLQREVRAGDDLLIVGRRLQVAAAARNLTTADFLDSIVSVSGIKPALDATIAWILDRYLREDAYTLSFMFTAVSGPQARVVHERVLPPDLTALAAQRPPGAAPVLTLASRELLSGVMRELIAISLYRCFAESLRSENWYRMHVLEGATENLKRRIGELGSLRNYLRQEEITEEMLEILSSGGFYAR
jgi:ATP synthase F1 gamma subunit